MERDIINQQSDALRRVVKANADLSDIIAKQQKEIAALKAENERLRAEQDAAIQVIYSCPTCTNCIHMDECDEIGGRCEGRGYGGDCHEPNDEPHFKWRGLEESTCG